LKYYLVAGEASGDLHGASLIKTLKTMDSNAHFRFFGGHLMQAAGGTLVKHYAEMAFMGFLEVVLNLKTILKNIKYCKADILAYQPDVLILIDFPGFNLKIAEFAKKNELKVCYYISPKVWAWNQKRVLKIKRDVDKLFCILPFEVAFYKKWGVEVEYVGNPLLDALANFYPNPNFIKDNQLGAKKIIALLPGSRKQEIAYILPAMLSVASQLDNYEFVIAGAPAFSKAFYLPYIGDKNISIVFNQTYDLLNNSYAALVTSGTATLETALFNVPQVVLYKGNAISIAIARMLVDIKFISLVNLIMDKGIVKELIQKDCNKELIYKELNNILGSKREEILHNYTQLNTLMGKAGASARVATRVYNWLAQSPS
jgi:lipid-A-disaccharide synthase